MNTSLRIFILAAAFTAFVPLVQADDVCDLRPDLCGGPARAIKKKKKIHRNVKSEAKPCRKRGEPYSLSGPELPVCGHEAANAAGDLENQMVQDQRRSPSKRKNRASDDNADFDSYLNANAKNPLLSNRAPASQSQSAFQPPKPRQISTTPDPVVIAQPFGGNPASGDFSAPPPVPQPSAAAPGPVAPSGESDPVSH